MARRKKKYTILDSPKKNRLVGAILHGENVSEVAANEGLPPSTLYTLRNKFLKTGSVSRQPGSGRPRTLDDRSERQLVKFAKKNRRVPFNLLGQNAVPTVSARTAKRVLDRHGLHRRKARKAPHLTPRKKEARLSHARKMLEEEDEVHEHLMWSDECYVQVGDTPGVIYVTRTPAEEFLEACTVPTFKELNVKVMVWGCIARGWKGPLLVLDYPGGRGGGMNTERYINQVLDGALLASYKQLQSERGSMSFMQDNASCHKSKKSLKWFEDHGIPLHPHPPSSPDLNPIEPCWADLKRLIRNRPHHPTTVAELKLAVEEAWETLTVQMIDKHTMGMRKRYEDLVAAKGGNTRF